MIALFGSGPPNQSRIYDAIGPACNYKNKRGLSRKPAWRCWLCPYCGVRSVCRTGPPFCRARGNSFIYLFWAIFSSLRKYRYRLDSTMIRKGSCIWSLFGAFSDWLKLASFLLYPFLDEWSLISLLRLIYGLEDSGRFLDSLRLGLG